MLTVYKVNCRRPNRHTESQARQNLLDFRKSGLLWDSGIRQPEPTLPAQTRQLSSLPAGPCRVLSLRTHGASPDTALMGYMTFHKLLADFFILQIRGVYQIQFQSIITKHPVCARNCGGCRDHTSLHTGRGAGAGSNELFVTCDGKKSVRVGMEVMCSVLGPQRKE